MSKREDLPRLDGFLTCRLPAADLECLRQLAAQAGLSRSEVLRQVIRTAAADRALIEPGREGGDHERVS